MRNFATESLRSFGLESDIFETRVLEEYKKVADVLRNGADVVGDADRLWSMCATNIIFGITCGQMYEYDDATFVDLIQNIDLILSGSTFASVLNFLPKCLHPLARSAYKEQHAKDQALDECLELVNGYIENHKSTFDPNKIRDFVDVYLKVSQAADSNFTKNEYLHSGNMFRLIYDFFLAGVSTISITMDWIILYLKEFPDVQRECRKRIHENVKCLPVRLSDKSKLAYIEAVIMECQRMSSVVPLGVPRTSMDHDIILDGFTIPKGTMVIPNLYSAHVDPSYWENPTQYKPERFLNSDGEIVRPKSFMPNSIGPRACIGEMFARDELFLLVSNLVANFEFTRDDESNIHDLSPDPQKSTSTRRPKKYAFRRTILQR